MIKYFYLFLLIINPTISFTEEKFCLNNQFLPTQNNSIHCYIKVSKKTYEDLSSINSYKEREKKYFASDDFKEIEKQRKEADRSSGQQNIIKKNDKPNENRAAETELEKRRRLEREDCEKRQTYLYDVNASARAACQSNKDVRDKNTCAAKYPPRYPESKTCY
jgi:hypothetical protein